MGSVVNGLCWRLVDLLSHALLPDERHAVLGDLEESGDSGARALSGVLGLVVRRQAALWKDWRPWLGFFGLALPLGLLLSFSAFIVDGACDLYLWIARNYATIEPRTLEESGLALRHGIVKIIAGSLLLVSWSRISGFVLGTLSRGAMWVNRTAFCLTLASVAFAEISRNHPYLYSVAGWVLPLTFYTVILPLLLLTALVLIPSLYGIHQSRHSAVPDLRISVLWTVSIVVLAASQPQLWFWKLSPFTALLVLGGYWPVGYLVAMSLSKEKLVHEKHETIGR